MGTNELHGAPSTAKRRKACGGRFRETCLGRCPSRTTGRNPAPTCPSRDYCVPIRSNRRDDRPLEIITINTWIVRISSALSCGKQILARQSHHHIPRYI